MDITGTILLSLHGVTTTFCDWTVVVSPLEKQMLHVRVRYTIKHVGCYVTSPCGISLASQTRSGGGESGNTRIVVLCKLLWLS